MSESNCSKQQKSLCDDRRCSGSSCQDCAGIEEAIRNSLQSQPVALGGGNGLDVEPKQDFKVSSSVPICQGCEKPEGSNASCPICAFFQEIAETAQNGDQNPDVPMSVVFQEKVGPRRGDLCALTPETVQISVDLLCGGFLSMVLPPIPVESQVPDSHVGQWRGCEWSSGNSWLVVILQMFQTGSWHTSINVSNPLGNTLWILVHKLRTTGFLSRQELQAFRRLMAQRIGENEKGTLFETGQMDPFEVLNMLEKAGAFRYYYRLSWTEKVEGIQATPVIDLGMLPSSSTTPIEEILSKLGIGIDFDQDSKFSCLPPAFLVRVSSSERISGSTVHFPTDAVFDICPLTFRIASVLLFINGHYLTVFIRFRYDPQTETVYTTYWLSDSKSYAQDCGHHVPSIVEINEHHFNDLWLNHAISIICVRIPNVVQIDGNLHEWNGDDFKPLMPASDSLPQCDNGQYKTFGPNGEIIIKKCMSLSELQCALHPPPSAPCVEVAQPLPPPPPPPCEQVARALPPPLPALYAQVARALPPPQAACAQVSQVPKHKCFSITQNDIVVSAKNWICSSDPEYFGTVEKTPHPKYPTAMMEVYFYENVSHTTLDELVKFINFIKSIQ